MLWGVELTICQSIWRCNVDAVMEKPGTSLPIKEDCSVAYSVVARLFSYISPLLKFQNLIHSFFMKRNLHKFKCYFHYKWILSSKCLAVKRWLSSNSPSRWDWARGDFTHLFQRGGSGNTPCTENAWISTCGISGRLSTLVSYLGLLGPPGKGKSCLCFS
jgi:hypothetical protein